jgi:PKHD-type hydroxylase
MTLDNYWYYFQDALPRRFCDDIIAFGNEKVAQTAVVGGFKGNVNDQNDVSKLYKTRNSSIVWLDELWIWREIEPYLREANKAAGWNYDIISPESFQFTKYTEKQHYSWHQDASNKPDKEGLIRKISLTLSLEDGDKYEGGDFEFDLRNDSESKPVVMKCAEARKKGTLIFFPSYVWHRVTPVTSGTRYSLVIWNRGLPYR